MNYFTGRAGGGNEIDLLIVTVNGRAVSRERGFNAATRHRGDWLEIRAEWPGRRTDGRRRHHRCTREQWPRRRYRATGRHPRHPWYHSTTKKKLIFFLNSNNCDLDYVPRSHEATHCAHHVMMHGRRILSHLRWHSGYHIAAAGGGWRAAQQALGFGLFWGWLVLAAARRARATAVPLSLVLLGVVRRYTLHSVYLYFDVAAIWQRVWYFVYGLFVNLKKFLDVLLLISSFYN